MRRETATQCRNVAAECLRKTGNRRKPPETAGSAGNLQNAGSAGNLRNAGNLRQTSAGPRQRENEKKRRGK